MCCDGGYEKKIIIKRVKSSLFICCPNITKANQWHFDQESLIFRGFHIPSLLTTTICPPYVSCLYDCTKHKHKYWGSQRCSVSSRSLYCFHGNVLNFARSIFCLNIYTYLLPFKMPLVQYMDMQERNSVRVVQLSKFKCFCSTMFENFSCPYMWEIV